MAIWVQGETWSTVYVLNKWCFIPYSLRNWKLVGIQNVVCCHPSLWRDWVITFTFIGLSKISVFKLNTLSVFPIIPYLKTVLIPHTQYLQVFCLVRIKVGVRSCWEGESPPKFGKFFYVLIPSDVQLWRWFSFQKACFLKNEFYERFFFGTPLSRNMTSIAPPNLDPLVSSGNIHLTKKWTFPSKCLKYTQGKNT